MALPPIPRNRRHLRLLRLWTLDRSSTRSPGQCRCYSGRCSATRREREAWTGQCSVLVVGWSSVQDDGREAGELCQRMAGALAAAVALVVAMGIDIQNT